MASEFPNDSWALILGGSSGFGLATAMRLAEAGMNVAIVHRDRRGAMARIEPEFEKIRGLGVEVRTWNVDATSPERREEVVADLRGALGANGRVRVLLHSIAFGNLKLIAPEKAEPRSAAYGPISVVTQSLSGVERIAVLPPGLFWPPPKVESVMMLLTRRATPPDGLTDAAGFARFVQQCFAHRRKTLRWALRRLEIERAESLPERIGVSRDARPEELSPALWRSLYREVLALRPS